jgi:uncharacterized protein YbcV (DUF1398 family)
MDSHSEQLIREAAAGSAEGRLHFGAVVDLLTRAGVESYVVDYRARRTTYFLADGECLDIALWMPDVTIGQNFSAEDLKGAIRGSQQGRINYPEFKRISAQAGCVAYTAWLAGRQVTYSGRRGETHVERFPD